MNFCSRGPSPSPCLRVRVIGPPRVQCSTALVREEVEVGVGVAVEVSVENARIQTAWDMDTVVAVVVEGASHAVVGASHVGEVDSRDVVAEGVEAGGVVAAVEEAEVELEGPDTRLVNL